MKPNTLDIEIAVATDFGYRQNVVVPNVSWGLGCLDYEADLVVLRPSGYAIEVEIKVSAQDIKADLKKHHSHDYIYFRELWFAVPSHLSSNPNIPDKAGIIEVWFDKNTRLRSRRIRHPKTRREAKKLPDKLQYKLLRLASMRTWTLKKHLQSHINRTQKIRIKP